MSCSLVSTPTPGPPRVCKDARASCHPHQSTTTMRRTALYMLVGAVSAVAVGCQDSVAPIQRVSPTGITAPSLSRSNQGRSDRTVLTTLTISPDGGTYHIGDFDVVIPAAAVCDPGSTAYGPKHWDRDCTPANRDITVQVIAQTHQGQVSIDFKPDLRFRPSAGWVTIRTAAYSDLLTSDAVRQLPASSTYFSNFVILYVPSGGQAHIDEVQSSGDPSLVTHVDRATGTVWRRVKHFSGYVVYSGDRCSTTTPDASTCSVDDGSVGTGTVTSMLGTAIISTLSVDSTTTLTSVVVTP